MIKLKFIVSLMLALGLVGCPDDENEKDDAKYSLKVAKPSSAKVGEAFSVEVKLYKGDALVKDDDAKGAKDADVTGSIKCKEHSAKVDLTKAKLSDAGKANLSVTIEDNSDKTAAAPGTKGYTDCVVSASTEFGDDKTKASGSSEKFDVAAKTASDDPGAEDGKPEFPATVVDGKEFSIKNGKGAKISFINTDGDWCDEDNNFFFKVADPVQEIDEKHTIDADGDKFFVVGSDCQLMIDGVTAKQTVTTAGNNDPNPTIGNIITDSGLGFAVAAGITGTKSGFVHAGGDNWTKIAADFPSSGGNWVATGVTPIASGSITATSHNRVLFGVDGEWSYKSDKPASN